MISMHPKASAVRPSRRPLHNLGPVFLAAILGFIAFGCGGETASTAPPGLFPDPVFDAQPEASTAEWGAMAGRVACVAKRLPDAQAQRAAEDAEFIRQGISRREFEVQAQALGGDPAFMAARRTIINGCTAVAADAQSPIFSPAQRQARLLELAILWRCLARDGRPSHEILALTREAWTASGLTMDAYLIEVAALESDSEAQTLLSDGLETCPARIAKLPTRRPEVLGHGLPSGTWEGELAGGLKGHFTITLTAGVVTNARVELPDTFVHLTGSVTGPATVTLAGQRDGVRLRMDATISVKDSDWTLRGTWRGETDRRPVKGRLKGLLR